MTAAVLVDTHILIWMRTQSARLHNNERAALDDAHKRYISPISFWEIALLIGVGKLGNEPGFFQLPAGFDLLPLSPKHCKDSLNLPAIHRDPFDRMLISQARVDALILVSRDADIRKYADSELVRVV